MFKSNDHYSSRSHALFKLTMNKPEFSVMVVDLAGSERHRKVETELLEAKYINQSLLCLGNCLKAFNSGNLVVPYRESKLTKSISEFFHPHISKIFVLSHINRSGQMFHENSTILHYASMMCKTSPLNPEKNKSLFK